MRRLALGLGLCAAVAAAARAAQAVEEWAVGQAYVEVLVLAILLGAALRTLWDPTEPWRPGIRFAAGPLLEVAIVLLGASLDLRAVAAAGPGLLLGVVSVVVLALLLSYVIGRAIGLERRVAVLVACGNAICGNSAIVAVAPVVGAGPREIASAIAFTAVLGVAVVLALPALAPALGLSATQYGTLAGLTVYAVPQVLAATAPLGGPSMQAGTLVKLLRVVMLGPVVLILSLLLRRRASSAGGGHAAPRWEVGRYVPWFVAGFLALATMRSIGLVPDWMLDPLRLTAGLLTALAMAALGLGVDIRAVARSGARVAMATMLSLVVLLCLSLGLIGLLGIP
ncbi:YeiH family protein [Falsiroseomonas sp.]|uniref:YeiH family protein n=1 Tax=Falsiroseomonas sp. TaxID=2870721 RepID=UPI003562FD15